MCLLTYYPADIQPDTAALRRGADINNDGHGFAIVSHGQLIIGHGMDADTLINKFERIRSKHHSGPALFHSRMATGGTVNRFNCHPFRIGGDKRTVLAHNGVMPALLQPRKGDKRCDTRITAEDMLRGIDLGDADYRDRLGSFIGGGNKLVILTVNPAYDSQAYLINEAAGVWEQDGMWYSNDDYRAVAPYDFGVVDAHSECVHCSNVGTIEVETNVCTVCDTCQDCLDNWSDCQCYVPLSDRPRELWPATGWIEDDAAAAARAVLSDW
jgi:glutamine amidotransferase